MKEDRHTIQSDFSTSWGSFPKIYALGHGAVLDIFTNGPVLLEEKIDGSFVGAGVFDGELKVRSKGVVMDVNAPEKMFTKAVNAFVELKDQLTPGWMYCGEFLSKPKHNTLSYDRHPEKHVILFDIKTGKEQYLSYEEKKKEAERLGLEIVPKLYEGVVENVSQLKELLETTSILGGQKIEGFVVKNYSMYGKDGKILMAKYVSEAFKEIHKGDWKKRHQTQGDVLDLIIQELRTEARWYKAVQHLRERGELENAPRDIGVLMKEIEKDTMEECEDYVKEKLFNWSKNKISRGIRKGFAPWYKEQLLKRQFEE